MYICCSHKSVYPGFIIGIDSIKAINPIGICVSSLVNIKNAAGFAILTWWCIKSRYSDNKLTCCNWTQVASNNIGTSQKCSWFAILTWWCIKSRYSDNNWYAVIEHKLRQITLGLHSPNKMKKKVVTTICFVKTLMLE